MIADLIVLAKDFGLPMVFCGVLLWLYREAHVSHVSERREWRDDSSKLHRDTSSVVKENNQVIRELIRVISDRNNRE